MEKFRAISRASILGVLGNVFLLFMKGLVGLLTGSQAMIADAFNSAGDIFSSIMTFLGNRIASKPSDEDHHLGHGKAEYIYSLLISIAMGFMALQVFGSSLQSLLEGKRYSFTPWLVVVCLATIVIKLLLYLYTHALNKKYKNLLLEANSKDHRNDCVLTFLNLIACLFSFAGLFFVDGLVGMIFAGWILLSAIKIFKESYDVLMDRALDEEEREKVISLVTSHKEVRGIQHFNATPVGYQYQISFTIYVDGTLSTFESHEIANHLEKEIGKTFPEIYLTVIHVNPCEVKREKKKKPSTNTNKKKN